MADRVFKLFGRIDITFLVHLIFSPLMWLAEIDLESLISFSWVDDWKTEIYYFDLYTAFTGDKYNIFAYLGNEMAEYLAIQPNSNYVRQPMQVPQDGWRSVFFGVYDVYYQMYVYTFQPWKDYAKYQYDVATAAASGADSISTVITTAFFGFEPQCAHVTESLLKKTMKILLAIPAWISYLLLALFRVTVLIGSAFGLIALVIADFFSDILRFIRNILWWCWDLVMGLIFVSQNFWESVWDFVKLLLIFPLQILSWLINLVITIFFGVALDIWLWFDQLMWDIVWFFYDLIYMIISPVINFLLYIILFIPGLLLTWWGMLMKLIFEPLDNVCVWWFTWQDELADSILGFLNPPDWDPSWIEWPIALPILMLNMW